MTKEQALSIHIMILTLLRWVEKPTKVVAEGRKTYFNKMKKRWLKRNGEYSVTVIDRKVVKYPKVVPDPLYTKVNDKVADLWDEAKESVLPKDKLFASSNAELLQVLWDRLNGTEYQTEYIGAKRMEAMIESLSNTKDETEIHIDETEAINNSRLLIEKFLSLAGIKKRHSLATRRKIIEGNLVLENG